MEKEAAETLLKLNNLKTPVPNPISLGQLLKSLRTVIDPLIKESCEKLKQKAEVDKERNEKELVQPPVFQMAPGEWHFTMDTDTSNMNANTIIEHYQKTQIYEMIIVESYCNTLLRTTYGLLDKGEDLVAQLEATLAEVPPSEMDSDMQKFKTQTRRFKKLVKEMRNPDKNSLVHWKEINKLKVSKQQLRKKLIESILQPYVDLAGDHIYSVRQKGWMASCRDVLETTHRTWDYVPRKLKF